MDNAIKTAKLAILILLFGLMIGGFVAGIGFVGRINRTLTKLDATLDATAATLTSANQMVAGVNVRLNAHGGLLDIAKATMLHADRAVGEAAIASRQQRVAAAKMDEAVLGTVAHVNTTLDSLAGNIRATTDDVHNSLIRVPALLDSTTLAINAANRTISNADIPKTLANIAETTKHVDGVAAHLEAMSGELDKSLHKTLNPSRKSLALGWVMTTLKLGAALSPLY